MAETFRSGALTWNPAGEEKVGPSRAWVDFADGRHMELEVRASEDEEGMFVASPADGGVLYVGEGDHLGVDYVGPGQRVSFDRVWRKPGE